MTRDEVGAAPLTDAGAPDPTPQVAKKYNSADNLVSVDLNTERVRFTVEGVGSLAPEQIVLSALRVLLTKLEGVSSGAAMLPGGA